MTWSLLYWRTEDNQTKDAEIKGEWSDSLIEEAAKKIKDAYGSDTYLNAPDEFNYDVLHDIVKEFLPKPIADALQL